MTNFIIKWYVKKKQEQYLLLQPHQCEDCGHTGRIVRRFSILYLLLIVLAGVLLGYFTNSFFLGLILVFVVAYLTGRTIKPQCSQCLSSNVKLAGSPNAQISTESTEQMMFSDANIQINHPLMQHRQIHKDILGPVGTGRGSNRIVNMPRSSNTHETETSHEKSSTHE